MSSNTPPALVAEFHANRSVSGHSANGNAHRIGSMFFLVDTVPILVLKALFTLQYVLVVMASGGKPVEFGIEIDGGIDGSMPEKLSHRFVVTGMFLQIKEGAHMPVQMRVYFQTRMILIGSAKLLSEGNLMLMTMDFPRKQPSFFWSP